MKQALPGIRYGTSDSPQGKKNMAQAYRETKENLSHLPHTADVIPRINAKRMGFRFATWPSSSA